MKGTKMAHPSQCREIVSETEIDRLLAQGWCEIKKPVNQNARKQRQFRARCKLLGYRRFAAYLPGATYAELIDAKKPDETMAELLIRLLRASREKSQVSTEN